MKKITSELAAIIMSFAMLASMLAACDRKPEGGGTFTPPVDEDPYVTELSVVTPPAKTTYKAGQLFDPAGMKLLAKWSDGEDEDLSPSECKKSPAGPLEAGTTAITFTYEGASCSQAITVTDRTLVNVTFDSSAVKDNQVAGAIDLTVIKVEALYDDKTSETVTAGQYKLTEKGQVISNPNAYVISPGQHTVKVEFGGFSHEFSFFAALEGFTVPITVYGADDFERMIASKESFLYKPNASDSYNHGGFENGEPLIYNIFGGADMRFYIYLEKQTEVEMKVRAASSQLLANSWDDVRKMGEEQFNKVFEISKVKVDHTTNAPELDGGNEIKTAIPIEDYVILPGGSSETHDPALKGNYVNLSLGETVLEAGYNIVEFKCVSEYVDFSGIKRGCQFVSLTVQTAFTAEHAHEPVKSDATAPDCIHYGVEQYYTCGVCGRMFSDEECTDRLLAYKYVQPVPGSHTPDIPAATCSAEQHCTVCGKKLADKVPHTFEHDLCSYDGEAECTVCHDKFQGGHILHCVTEQGVTEIECIQCNKTLGVKIQAENTTSVKHYNKNGTLNDLTWHIKAETNVPNNENNYDEGWHAVSNGTEGSCLWDLNGANWQGGYMEISVNVAEAGVYTFAARTQYGGNTNNGSEPQDLTGILSYCVNPVGERSFTPINGKAVPASRGINWNRLYLWGTTVFADINLNAGNNTVVLKIADVDGVRACQIDSFIFEKKGEIKHPDAEIISWDASTGLYDAGTRQYGSDVAFVDDGILCIASKPVYMRIKLTDEKAQELGWAFEDVAITQDVLTAANFVTTAGEHSATFTVEKYGKTYSAAFNYTVV